MAAIGTVRTCRTRRSRVIARPTSGPSPRAAVSAAWVPSCTPIWLGITTAASERATGTAARQSVVGRSTETPSARRAT